eukprot:jgi/Pico_ML_1/52170/g378.t2
MLARQASADSLGTELMDAGIQEDDSMEADGEEMKKLDVKRQVSSMLNSSQLEMLEMLEDTFQQEYRVRRQMLIKYLLMGTVGATPMRKIPSTRRKSLAPTLAVHMAPSGAVATAATATVAAAVVSRHPSLA